MKKNLILTFALSIFTLSCMQNNGNFNKEELSLINSADSIMRVLTINDSLDAKVLRAQSTDLSPEALASDDYIHLCGLMLATVTHPSQDGVGIAAPQVGINRRLVAVQRFDMPNCPFEVYPNIHIIHRSDSLKLGAEGCLSVPGMRGEVMRSTEITIEYTDMSRLGDTSDQKVLPVIQETVSGFTAVIFQHEVDHLEGMIYTDRLTSK